MPRALRIVVVTGGLALAGGIMGAACGVLLLLVPWLVTEGLRWLPDAGILLVPALFGAAVGAVAAPALAWGLLRHVALGRALAHTAVGTLLGGGLGWALARNPWLPGIRAVIAGGLVGFVLAGVRLRFTARAASAPSSAERGD
jgi:hypothetical protein